MAPSISSLPQFLQNISVFLRLPGCPAFFRYHYSINPGGLSTVDCVLFSVLPFVFCGIGLTCRCDVCMGGLRFWSPAAPAISFLCCPYPPTPFPGGEGGDSKIILLGATAPGTPAFDRLRHRLNLRSRHPAGAYPRRCRLTLSCRCPAAEPGRRWDGASPAPGGGLPPALPVDTAAVMFAWAACVFGRLPALPLVLILPPFPEGEGYPPTPFPGGEGGDQGYFMQGASPLAFPALNRLRHRLNLRSRHPAGAYPRRCRLPLSCRCPAAEPGRHCIDFGTAIPRGFAGERWFGQRQIQEKFLGVWGLLSRSPQCSSPPTFSLSHAPPVSAAHYGTSR